MRKREEQHHKRCFTLLELMVAFAILAIAAAGIGGWKVHRMVERKRFLSDVEKLRSRLLTCHRLALNMQADWQGVLEKRGNGWVFTVRCIDQPNVRGFAPLPLHSFSFFFNGEEKKQWIVEFSATGEISPCGILEVSLKERKETWEIPALFQKEKNEKKLGPLHPNLLPL